MSQARLGHPYLGLGVGLRTVHFPYILEHHPPVDWFDPVEFIRSVPHERVVQFHLAGHTDCRTHLIDTHDGHVVDPVWELYRLAHRLTGGASTLLEWDAKIPEFPVVHAEVLKARRYMQTELGDPATGLRPAQPASQCEVPRENTGRPTTVPHPAAFIPADVE